MTTPFWFAGAPSKARRKPHRRPAFTLVEVLFVSFLLTLLLLGGVTLLQGSSRLFGSTSGGAYAEINLARGGRIVEAALANAREYAVAADGQSITYFNNDASYPPKKDNTVHYFKRDPAKTTNLIWSDAPVSRPVLTSVPANDPATGGALALFGPAGAQIKDGSAVTVRLVCQQTSYVGGAAPRITTRRTLIRVTPRNTAKGQ